MKNDLAPLLKNRALPGNSLEELASRFGFQDYRLEDMEFDAPCIVKTSDENRVGQFLGAGVRQALVQKRNLTAELTVNKRSADGYFFCLPLS